MFSWNHFLWDKVKTHVSIYWYKLGKKHWKMMTFWRYVIANSSKNIEKSGLLKTCVKISYVIHPKASIHTKRRCGPIEQSTASTSTVSANFDQFHRANLSEISSTCIGTVRHTRHKFLGFFVFFKDPYWCAHFRRSFFVIPPGRSISGAIFC